MAQERLQGTFFGPTNLVDLLRHRACCQPNDLAFTYLIDGENQQAHLTYRELDRQVRAIAAWLQEAELAGQRVLLCYPPSLEFITAFLGCLYAKVVAVPVYPPRRNQLLTRIEMIAQCAGARVALTTEAVNQRVKPVTDESELRKLRWMSTCGIPPGTEDRWRMPDVDGDTLAFLQYTSGSTGTPKGVMLNHSNLMHNSALIAHSFEHTRSGLGVFWLPSYHDMGLIGGILQPLFVGRPNVMMSPMSFLQKPFRWLSAISRFGGTTSGGPNFAYDLCVRRITPEQKKTLDLSTWQVAFNGAEPVRAETIDRFVEAFAPCGFRREAFFPCYGLAEATLIVSGGYTRQPPVVRQFDAAALTEGRAEACAADDAGARSLVGSGQKLPDEDLAIVDPETLIRLPEGRVGEIWASGPSIAQGYWDQPEATQATFRAMIRDTGEGPFLRTGDLGFLNDGELFVTGRIKDLIIVHGVNHYPQDIELTVERSHARLRPGCGAAFALDCDGRETVGIVHEMERRTQDDVGEIVEAIRRAVSAEHDLTLEAIVLIRANTIPKTSSGKIKRHACRQGYLDGTLSVVGLWTAEAGLAAISPRGGSDSLDPPETDDSFKGDVVSLRVQPDKPVRVAVETRPRTGTPAVASLPARVGGDGASTAAAGSLAGNGSTGNGNGKSNGHGNGNGHGKARAVSTLDVVSEEIRRVARDRAAGMTLDTVIADCGLDSLERMEIVASLEERYGGRFPEEVLPVMETVQQVVDAVEKYLGTTPKQRAARPETLVIPEEQYRVDRFPECVRLQQSLEAGAVSGLENPFFHVHEGLLNNRTVIAGREVVNFASYNYLGLSGHPAVSRAAKKAIDRYGTSVSASRLVSGEKDLHGQLEGELTRFLGTADTLVFSAGHATNETVIGHLFGPGDLILHDALAHNSIVQGAILSGARRRPFLHNDWEAADRILTQFRHEYRRVLIAIEGAYSMDGDYPNLPEFVRVKNRHKAILMIDEAHSLGTMGATGRGIGEHYGVDRGDVEIWMGTLSKSLGSCGGYISASADLVRYLKYTAPGFVFSAGITPANTAAALAALKVLQAEPQRVHRLADRAKLFLRLAGERGMNTGTSCDTPVIPIILGNSQHCLRAAQALLARGVNARPILHPAVEESASRLRFFITSEHTEDEIQMAVDVLAEELEKIDPGHVGKTAADRQPAAYY